MTVAMLVMLPTRLNQILDPIGRVNWTFRTDLEGPRVLCWGGLYLLFSMYGSSYKSFTSLDRALRALWAAR